MEGVFYIGNNIMVRDCLRHLSSLCGHEFSWPEVTICSACKEDSRQEFIEFLQTEEPWVEFVWR